jgi:hypothetical protein
MTPRETGFLLRDLVGLLLILVRNWVEERKSEIRSSSILLITFLVAADREFPATIAASLEPAEETPNSLVRSHLAF